MEEYDLKNLSLNTEKNNQSTLGNKRSTVMEIDFLMCQDGLTANEVVRIPDSFYLETQ